MSKVDQLRALREARHDARQKANTCLQKAPASPSSKSKVKATEIASAKRKKVATAKAALAATVDVSHMANSVVANTSTAYRYRDHEERKIYQRDLMRKRRATVKTDA